MSVSAAHSYVPLEFPSTIQITSLSRFVRVRVRDDKCLFSHACDVRRLSFGGSLFVLFSFTRGALSHRNWSVLVIQLPFLCSLPFVDLSAFPHHTILVDTSSLYCHKTMLGMHRQPGHPHEPHHARSTDFASLSKSALAISMAPSETDTRTSGFEADPGGGSPHATKAIDASQYRTKLCSNYLTHGACTYGPRCMFAHGDTELRTREMNASDQLETTHDITTLRNAERRAVKEADRRRELRRAQKKRSKLRKRDAAQEAATLLALATTPMAGNDGEDGVDYEDDVRTHEQDDDSASSEPVTADDVSNCTTQDSNSSSGRHSSARVRHAAPPPLPLAAVSEDTPTSLCGGRAVNSLQSAPLQHHNPQAQEPRTPLHQHPLSATSTGWRHDPYSAIGR
jgi:hypothetical protein